MSGESVKVAVRVRPFNKRENDRNAKLIIEMQNAMTLIQDPDNPGNPPKEFTFDFSYWSHDGFDEAEDGYLSPQPSSKYSDQRKVFDDLGQGVLNNAFQGFNCSLFAYGQTGSGKSYSMVGYGNNKGIVPITCDELFKSIDKDTSGTKFEVMFSMLEIYNEQVRDLLTKDNPKGGLQVRQNPKENAFYVQGLKKVAVGSYVEIEKRTDEGTSNRTVAATNMNATSSRAHTVVTVQFDQIAKNAAGQETKKSSVINLVDLAGSERADSTGATGDRLKEGANINKSLSALGNVISALADLSMGKKKVLVPYRDSALTKLLQNALGGNSKTIMIAALSPADINYDETLGTLRYADRAKKIKNKAVVNENPMDKLIRELRAENEKLKALLTGGGTVTDEMKEQMRMNMEEMMTFDEKLALSREEATTSSSAESEKSTKMKTLSHLVNLNEDPQLSGVIVYFLKDGETLVGQKTREETQLDIALSGLSISKQHALITCKDGEYTIKPATQGAKTKVNGIPLTGERVIKHFDRVLFGSNHHYYFVNPKNTEKSEGSPDVIDWEVAQKEIAQAKGFNTGITAGLSKEQQVVQEQVLEILPLVTEVNAISEELDKHKTFEVILLSGAAQGNNSGDGTKVVVKMKDLRNDNVWLWERGKFMNRRYMMQEMYQQYVEGEDMSKTPKEEDPFWEPLEDILVGSANVFLQSLAYALDFDDKLAITDYKGNEEGSLYLNVAPCTQSGKALDEDYFVDDPADLVGKPYHFKITIRSAEINKTRYCNGLYVSYRAFNEESDSKTEVLENTLSPEFKHSRIISFPAITQDHLSWFDSGCITFQMFAKQVESLNDNTLSKMTTKELRQMDHMNKPAIGPRSSTFAPNENSDGAKLKSELILLKRKNDRLVKKEKRIQEICEEWDKKSPEQQSYEAFYRAVSAAAYYQSGRLRYRVNMVHSLIKAQQSATANGGQIKMEDGSGVHTSRACVLM